MTSDEMGPKGLGRSVGVSDDIGDETASVVELTGVIKWFDVAKGYGFIIPDNGMPDILLHVTCLRRDGFQVAYEGARVVVEVQQRPRGLQAFRIISMDELDRGAPSGNAAAAHARHGRANRRLRACPGQVVQSTARFRIPHPG